MFPILMAVILPIIALLVGYAMGRYHQRMADEEHAERMERLDPPRRTAGAPANMEAQPSDVNRPKWRSGTFKSGPPHRM